MNANPLVENYFRHEYGRLVAMLLRRVGPQHISAVEDAVQNALMRALETWPRSQAPANPSAWLFRVAHNELMSSLRGRSRRDRLYQNAPEEVPHTLTPALANELSDDLLKMLFVCCESAIPAPSQLVLALKTLCGFSVSEIAQRLFMSEANVYKRLARALKHLRKTPRLRAPSLADEQARLPAVHNILYVLFTEGHLSSHAELAIRKELCLEALRLCEILAAHPTGQNTATFALMALMHLHLARMDARQDGEGGLLLLEEQDRSLYDRAHIATGLHWLSRASEGDAFSRYHAEAGIAAEHCLAKSFAETRWENVVASYELLEEISPSAIHRLNRAVAAAELHGPVAGLDILRDVQPPTWLAGSYLWSAVLADLHKRAGHSDAAERYRALALSSAPTKSVRDLLQRRLSREL